MLTFAITTKAKPIESSATDSIALEGRWDLTINQAGKEKSAWLEVRHSGSHTLVGDFVGISGSARPISKVNFNNGKFNFTLPPQWEKGDKDVVVEGTMEGDNLAGSITFPDGMNYSWTGVRAPSLNRATEPSWGKPIALIDKESLKGWHALGENQWKVENGVLRSPKSGSNLVTDATYQDFKLHVEFRYPKGSNSGIYLRGRYELQIADSKGLEASRDQLGAIYGFIIPNEMVAKEANEWQSFDITLVGRLITVIANGKTIICRQQIPGITGAALDSKEDEPGPLFIQGDHGAVEFRNIVITPAR